MRECEKAKAEGLLFVEYADIFYTSMTLISIKHQPTKTHAVCGYLVLCMHAFITIHVSLLAW